MGISAPTITSVRAALEAFCNPEEVREGQATRRLQFGTLPKILILNLKRFSYAKGVAKKIHKSVTFEEKLALNPRLLLDGGPSPEYWATAVVCHHGETVNKGHYTAFVRYNSDWFSYDDTTVRKVEGKEVAAQQFSVYLLVYQQRATIDMAP